MDFAVKFSYSASGAFLVVGLVLGTWKWRCMARSDQAKAPYYVDISHRAALMYSFACLVLAKLAELSALSGFVEAIAAVSAITFFALAVATYVVHGILRDTDNQLARPHRLGRAALPRWLVATFMWLLVAAELGGVSVLAVGAVRALWA